MMLLNRQQVIERLKAGCKLYESGNTMMFKDGAFCTAATDNYLTENGLVKVSGGVGRETYAWLAPKPAGVKE